MKLESYKGKKGTKFNLWKKVPMCQKGPKWPKIEVFGVLTKISIHIMAIHVLSVLSRPCSYVLFFLEYVWPCSYVLFFLNMCKNCMSGKNLLLEL